MKSSALVLAVLLAPVVCLATDTATPPGEAGELLNGWTGASLLLLSEVIFRGARTKKAMSWLWIVVKVAESVAELAGFIARSARGLAELGDKKLPQRRRKPKTEVVSETSEPVRAAEKN